MSNKHHPNIISTGQFIISEGTRLPGWWKTKSYEEMLRDWRHTTLRESVRADIAKGEAVPPEVLAYFPDL